MNYNNTNQEGEYQPRPVFVPPHELPQSQPSYTYDTDYSYPQQNLPPTAPVFVSPQESPQSQSQSQPSYAYDTDYSYPQQNPPPTAPVYHISVHASEPVTNPEETTELLKIYSYRRTLYWFTGIDAFFCIIMAFSASPIYLIALLFCYFGFLGAKKYKPCLLIFYFIYLGLRIVSTLLSMIYYPSVWVLFLGMISILVSGYIFRFVIKFYMMVKMLSENTIDTLRSGWTPVQGAQIIYY